MCLSFLLLLLLLLLSTPLPRHSDSWNPLSLSKSGVLSALDQQSAPAVGRPSPLSLVRSLVWRHSTPWAGRCLRIETRKASALSDIYLGGRRRQRRKTPRQSAEPARKMSYDDGFDGPGACLREKRKLT
ncbi:hypothetical protein TgHK011_007594 [Trichoderma gracile]|nr:hypothetical protein TgHK011_007594 [Trichoderma gracile]